MVNLLAPPATVADRQHCGANTGSKTLIHCHILRFSRLAENYSPKLSTIRSLKNEKIEGSMQTGALAGTSRVYR